MSNAKCIWWTAERQGLLDEARRILKTESDSETIGAALAKVVQWGPSLSRDELEKIREAHHRGEYGGSD